MSSKKRETVSRGDLLLFPDIKGVAKKFSKRSKSHRSAADFDTAFVNRIPLETE
jgi:hypothetical protein